MPRNWSTRPVVRPKTSPAFVATVRLCGRTAGAADGRLTAACATPAPESAGPNRTAARPYPAAASTTTVTDRRLVQPCAVRMPASSQADAVLVGNVAQKTRIEVLIHQQSSAPAHQNYLARRPGCRP